MPHPRFAAGYRVRSCSMTVVLLAVGAIAPASALGATAEVTQEEIARYRAAPGEPNDVTVDEPREGILEFSDTGATITARRGCRSVTPHLVRCNTEDFLASSLEVAVGDGDDSVSLGQLVFFGEGSLYGGDGNDVIDGGRANFWLYLYGEEGDDRLRGGPSSDTFVGGPGADTFADAFTDDIDEVTYRRRVSPVRVVLDRLANDGETGEGDNVLPGIWITGGAGDDVLLGDERRNGLGGGGGNDLIHGRGGADLGHGGSGNDIVLGGAGRDALFGAAGDDLVRGGPGDDGGVYLDAPLSGGRGNDVIWSGEGRDWVAGGRGRDTLHTRDGRPDRVSGGPGTDRACVDRRLDRVETVERFPCGRGASPLTG